MHKWIVGCKTHYLFFVRSVMLFLVTTILSKGDFFMSNNASQSLVKGTFILTVATAISKILGFIYIVPFTALVGTQGNILFEYAYKPYILLLSLATMGIPLAVSKFVSKYNQLGDYHTGWRLFKSGLVITTLTGIVWFVILYTSAPAIAAYLIDENDTSGNAISHVVFVIRMVSFALIIVPPMGIARGYFQGHQDMKPTAISQMIEQLVRIVFILVAAFIIIILLKKEVYVAVGFATFSAFMGAVAGAIYLFFCWYKRKGHFQQLISSSKPEQSITLPSIYKELFSYAIPFVIVGLGISLYQSVDTFLINKAMLSTNHTLLEAETENSIISLTQRLILIPVSLATAFSLTLVPVITESFTAGKIAAVRQQVTKTIQIILFFTLPASVGLMVLGREAFGTLFGINQLELGGTLLTWSAPTAILFSFFLVTSSMLQGLNQQKKAVISMLIGLGFKLATTYYFVVQFKGIGSIVTTNIGMILTIAINLYVIHKIVAIEKNSLGKQSTMMVFATILMSIFVGVSYYLNDLWITSLSNVQIQVILHLAINASVGALVYVIVMIKTGIFFDVMGNRIRPLNRFNKKNTQ